ALRYRSPIPCCFASPPTAARSAGLAARESLGLGACVVDRADQVEGLLGQVVAFAVENFSEAAHGFLARHVSARDAGERLRDMHRLREKALDAARARDHQLVVGGQLVHPEDRDDVLEVLIALKNLLHPACDVLMFLADDRRFKNAGGRANGSTAGKIPFSKILRSSAVVASR